MPVSDLAQLEKIRASYGERTAQTKLDLLRRLDATRLVAAAQVARLHEVLCFLRTYPDDQRVHSKVTRMLAAFDRRADLRQFREELADSGIAGTTIRYRFFWSTALWLARRWPARLRIERDDEDAAARLDKALPLVLPQIATEWYNAGTVPALPAIDRLRGPQTDAAYLITHLARMPGDGFTREAFADALDLPFVLSPGRGTPSRTLAHFPSAPVAYQQGPLRRHRPDLREAAKVRPKAVKMLSPEEGATLIELARSSMVTRARDLAAFEYADPHDVRMIDDGDGLAFGLCGVIPERRYLLPALYGALTLKNGVPIGYVQLEVIGRFAAVSFNTFETWRGAEAAHVFSRLLAIVRHVFGAASLSIEPYQLGQDNAEGIETGAWWFYYKLGFRPKASVARRLVSKELVRLRDNPLYRSPEATLLKLAEWHLYFELDGARSHGLPPIQEVLRRGILALAEDGGGEKAEQACEQAALARTDLKSLDGFTAGERLAWKRWAPIVASMPEVMRWSPAERRALGDVVRAKGARRETTFVEQFAKHPKLARALFGAA